MTDQELVEAACEKITEHAVAERHNRGMYAYVERATKSELDKLIPIIAKRERLSALSRHFWSILISPHCFVPQEAKP